MRAPYFVQEGRGVSIVDTDIQSAPSGNITLPRKAPVRLTLALALELFSASPHSSATFRAYPIHNARNHISDRFDIAQPDECHIHLISHTRGLRFASQSRIEMPLHRASRSVNGPCSRGRGMHFEFQYRDPKIPRGVRNSFRELMLHEVKPRCYTKHRSEKWQRTRRAPSQALPLHNRPPTLRRRVLFLRSRTWRRIDPKWLRVGSVNTKVLIQQPASRNMDSCPSPDSVDASTAFSLISQPET